MAACIEVLVVYFEAVLVEQATTSSVFKLYTIFDILERCFQDDREIQSK